MEQAVAADADQLGSVPCEEGPGGLADASRVCELAETDRAATTLIAERPTQGEEADGERGYDLNVVRGLLAHRGAEVGNVDRAKEDDGKDQEELGREEGPAAELFRSRELVMRCGVLSQRKRRGGRERKEREHNCEDKDVEGSAGLAGERVAGEIVRVSGPCRDRHVPPIAEMFVMGQR